jgi:hypothetical protein
MGFRSAIVETESVDASMSSMSSAKTSWSLMGRERERMSVEKLKHEIPIRSAKKSKNCHTLCTLKHVHVPIHCKRRQGCSVIDDNDGNDDTLDHRSISD